MSIPSRQQAALARERDAARRTHRIGPRVSRVSSREWVADTQLVVPKAGRPYYRAMPSARNSSVRKEAEKIQAKGTASVVVTVAGVLDEDMYEGDEFLPKGTFVMLSRRVPVDNLVAHLQAHPYDTQAQLTIAVGLATDFNFASVKSVYIREDRIGGGVG